MRRIVDENAKKGDKKIPPNITALCTKTKLKIEKFRQLAIRICDEANFLDYQATSVIRLTLTSSKALPISPRP
jgi:hypothetical protein